jgi:hypothetical protein
MKYQVLRATITQEYLIPIYEGGATINGWSVDKLKHEWFERFDMNTFHASREGHRTGNSIKVVKVEDVGFLESTETRI